MSYSLFSYEGYAEGVTQLLDTCFKIVAPVKSHVTKWKFFSKNSLFAVFAWVATTSLGTVVSFYSNKSIPVVMGSKRFKAAMCLDMATHPEHRRQGLITNLSQKVYGEITKRGFDFSFGFSNEAGVVVDRNAREYGYRVVGRLQQFFLFSFFPRKSRYSLKKVQSFTREVPEYKDFLQIETSPAYLTWRYIEKPNSNYVIYEVWQDEMFHGYCITKNQLCHLSVFKIACGATTDLRDVIKSVQNIALQSGRPLVRLSVLANVFWKKVVTQFLTVSFSKKRYYLTVKQHSKKNISASILFNPHFWLVMGGDII